MNGHRSASGVVFELAEFNQPAYTSRPADSAMIFHGIPGTDARMFTYLNMAAKSDTRRKDSPFGVATGHRQRRRLID